MDISIETIRGMSGHSGEARDRRNRFAKKIATEESVVSGHALYLRMVELIGIGASRATCEKIVRALTALPPSKTRDGGQLAAKRLSMIVDLLEAQSLEMASMRAEMSRLADSLGLPKAEATNE